jgi:hypothetical protein
MGLKFVDKEAEKEDRPTAKEIAAVRICIIHQGGLNTILTQNKSNSKIPAHPTET